MNVEKNKPHRRANPLNGRHVLVSPQRSQRPWQGAADIPNTEKRLTHDPKCYLCARNIRASGKVNPDYQDVFIFDNDFPALNFDNRETTQGSQCLMEKLPVTGMSRVICFSANHSLTLPELSVTQLAKVVDAWCEQTAELGRHFPWVQVFENKGEVMGCSNPHPHGQIWATSYVPDEASLERTHQHAYFTLTGQRLLLDIVEQEEASGERIVVRNDHWLAIVPFWASWPFEILLLPRFAVARLPELQQEQRHALAHIIKRLTTRYDNLFQTSFPYSMGWHGAPFLSAEQTGWQLHAHFYPPLLRSASIRKFMVGFEMLAEAQRDLTPEQAAEYLRAVSDEVHYLDNQDEF